MASHRRLHSALAVVAALLLLSAPLYAARELKQLGGLLGAIGGAIGAITNPIAGLLAGPTLSLSYLTSPLGTVGIVTTSLASITSIDFGPSTAINAQPAAGTPISGPFLYVWNAYGKSYTDPALSLANQDFLVTIDLNKNSPTYKKIIQYTTIGSIGNEPHHISISYDRTRLLGGSLLSFLRGQDDAYLFDITDPRRPVKTKSAQLVATAVTDHVFGLANGNFLVTQMGSKVGGAPGGISLWTKDLEYIASYPPLGEAPANFNPHGAAVDSAANLLLTSDFVLPVSTVTSQVFTLPGLNLLGNNSVFSDYVSSLSNIVTRNTVRVWTLNDLTIRNTIVLPGALGVIDVKIIPGNNPNHLAYATGVFNGGLYLVNPTAGTATQVIDFGVDAHPHLLAPANADGTRFFLTLNKAGYFLYLDTTDPYKPKVLQALYLGDGASPHYITPVGPGDNRVVVADYFLDQGTIGKVHAGGNKKVFVIPFNSSSLDAANTLVFNFAPINGRPHGIATNLQYTDVEGGY